MGGQVRTCGRRIAQRVFQCLARRLPRRQRYTQVVDRVNHVTATPSHAPAPAAMRHGRNRKDGVPCPSDST